MSVALMETTLELWASALRETKARMRSLFLQERMARSAGLFLDGLLGPERLKTGGMQAEAIRRHRADGELAYFSTWRPADTPIEALVAVEGHRWATEDAFETAKNELGLDHNETRSWHG